MKKILFLLLMLLVCNSLVSNVLGENPKSSVVPTGLHCAYLENPIGLDVSRPRLGWVFEATNMHAFGQRQTA